MDSRHVAYLKAKHRVQAQRAGTWQPVEQVDPAQAREHIAWLRQQYGLSLRVIAGLAGVNGHPMGMGVLAGICYPTGAQGRTWIERSTHDRIMAVRFDLDALPDEAIIGAWGSQRRLRALAYMGHAPATLGPALGLHPQHLSRLRLHRDGVVARHARGVRDLYERLWNVQGPNLSALECARRVGWQPPAAWDDDTMDQRDAQPWEQPAVLGPPRIDFDEVMLLLDGGRDLRAIAAEQRVEPESIVRKAERWGTPAEKARVRYAAVLAGIRKPHINQRQEVSA